MFKEDQAAFKYNLFEFDGLFKPEGAERYFDAI